MKRDGKKGEKTPEKGNTKRNLKKKGKCRAIDKI